MKKISIILLFATVCLNCIAHSIDVDEAKAIAMDFLTKHEDGYVNGRKAKQIRLVQYIPKTTEEYLEEISSDTLIYLFNLSDNQGFIIVSGDSRCKPILGYSFEGGYQEPKEGSIGEMVMRNLYTYVKNVVEGKTKPQRVFYPRKEGLPDRVDPLLPNMWDQKDPFNRLCPMKDTLRCVTGCVATAQAQVMHYHRWPVVGTGTFTYTDRLGCNQELTADFSTHRYDWDHMLYRYDGDFTDQEANAVALLMSDCGVACRMRYGPIESGARPIYQVQSLYEFFGYDAGMQMYYHSFYQPYEWRNMFMEELASGRPILYSGWSISLAHAFVCDGYDENGMFHFDWGMTGYTNGYYDLEIMSPDQPEWYDKNNPEGGMNLLQMAIVGVKPAEQGSQQTHLFALSHIAILNGEAKRGGELSVATHNLCNIGWVENEGKTALALKDNDGVVACLTYYDRKFDLEEITDTSYTDTLTFSISADVAVGTYRLCVVYDDNGEWKEAKTTIGTPNYANVRVGNDKVSITTAEESQASLSLVNLNFPDTLIQYKEAVYSLSIRNDGADYFGRLIFYCEDLAGTLRLLNDIGIYVPHGETITRTFSRKQVNLPAGKYHLKVACDIDVLSDSIIILNPPRDIYVAKQDANAINEIVVKQDNSHIYDVSGRPVHPYSEGTTRPKDIFIFNGKKTYGLPVHGQDF
ncbi:MAG: C10 family peptidase [Bacteroidaceae bacterium]|nr:C10 family peptidase [Bacteroidaceae bacterium]